MVRQDECAEERIEAEAGIVEEMEEKERKKERERNRKRELEGPKVEWINCSQSLTQSVSQKKERDRQRHRLSVFNKKMKDMKQLNCRRMFHLLVKSFSLRGGIFFVQFLS